MSKIARVESPTETSSPPDYDRPKAKRTRVALACLRCRSRKQKCDGAQGCCSTCRRLGLECHYRAHLTPRPDQKRVYIQALEEHIAGLEQLLAESGHDSVTVDHWKEKRQQIRRDSYMQDDAQTEEYASLPATTKDPVWNAIINSGNDTSLTTGRLFKSVVHNDINRTAMLTNISSDTTLLAELAPPKIASKLLDGWIKHLSTQYPVIHTPRLREIHARQSRGLNLFEECLLHLVYANSARMLEAVSSIVDCNHKL